MKQLIKKIFPKPVVAGGMSGETECSSFISVNGTPFDSDLPLYSIGYGTTAGGLWDYKNLRICTFFYPIRHKSTNRFSRLIGNEPINSSGK